MRGLVGMVGRGTCRPRTSNLTSRSRLSRGLGLGLGLGLDDSCNYSANSISSAPRDDVENKRPCGNAVVAAARDGHLERGGGVRQVWNGMAVTEKDGRCLSSCMGSLSRLLPSRARCWWRGGGGGSRPATRDLLQRTRTALFPHPLLPSLPLLPPLIDIQSVQQVQCNLEAPAAWQRCSVATTTRAHCLERRAESPGARRRLSSMWSWQTNCVRVLPTSSTLRYGDTTFHGTTGIAAASPQEPTMCDSLWAARNWTLGSWGNHSSIPEPCTHPEASVPPLLAVGSAPEPSTTLT